jgi:NAD(P)-dependent dehydrogenase (short-subunit alcohol dehydrogenase family)
MPPWSLISPASRGIGFALARRVLQTTTAPVVATARRDLDKTKEELLKGLGVDESRLKVLKLDVLGTLAGATDSKVKHHIKRQAMPYRDYNEAQEQPD